MEQNQSALSYELIVEQKKLVDPSLAALIYGDTYDERSDTLSPSAAIRISHFHDLFLFYAVLIQAYEIARAINKQCTVEQLQLPGTLAAQISDYWHGKHDLADSNNVYSFLISWVREKQADVFNPALPTQVFTELGGKYADYCKNTRFSSNSEGENSWIGTKRYLALLQYMPLFKACSLDQERDVLTFTTPEGAVSVPCLPFIFHRKNASFPDGTPRSKAYLFTSAGRGEKNDWPILRVFDLSRSEQKQLRIDAGSEGLRMICKSVGLNTVWYSVEDCWCDLAYLKRVIDATCAVLRKYLRVTHNGDIFEDIKNLYRDTEIYAKLDELQGGRKEVYSGEDSLIPFLYEMFITFGVFRSLYGLFMDPWEKPYSEKLFELFMEYFRSKSIITENKEKSLRRKLAASVAEHTQKLKRISAVNTMNYRMRKREILAEWNAFTVLQAAGINANSKLFADKERMLSIDDYYRMVRNPSTTVEDDLCDVLTLLNCIYGPLVDCGEDAPAKDASQFRFDERDYRTRMLHYHSRMQGKSLTELFDTFLDIVKRADKERDRKPNEPSLVNPAVEKCLGRINIIRSSDVEVYRNEILRCLQEQPPEPACIVNGNGPRRIFISYCHRDEEAVMFCCELLQEHHFDIILDEIRFHAGDDWKQIAQKEIGSPECVGVLVFFSRHVVSSDAVEFELNHAKRKNKPIVVVNLDDDVPSIYQYLDDIEHSDEHEEAYNAGKLKKYFPESRIFRRPTEYTSKLIPDLRIMTEKSETNLGVMDGPYTELEEQVINFYALLKYGYESDSSGFGFRRGKRADEFFTEEMEQKLSVSRCIFPLIVSVRETKIKRDNIALIGYEIIKNNTTAKRTNQYILSSKRLDTDDYYCIPNYRLMGANGAWMVEPFLVKRWDLPKKRELPKEEHHE